ncbi:type-1 angiotensin II receptor-associated protein [Physeter macrocephalus]|uniref:Type-1 angiotensin II receptor-associated protein n=1 Tax=Physeter macrocephalus TaxID=9755 RepID=A0A455B4Z2_PHYMC|nr:type-1 angiotensin II receptor-associated protein [Physeter catodon]|eukprot:XP_028343862.1 type-1 angiotensin II receptor-associated protein [Physeter catodon]
MKAGASGVFWLPKLSCPTPCHHGGHIHRSLLHPLPVFCVPQAILLVHWLLTIWGCIVFPGAYAWSNFTILALGVWAVAQRDSTDAISMFLGGLAVTIVLDIIHISIFYPRASLSDTARFSAGMAIVSALLKPVSCFFVYQMYRERGAFLGPSQEHSAYQTIDSPEVPADLESRAHVPQGY